MTTLGTTALPEHGIEAEAAYRSIHDELLLDDPAGANLGSFVTPRMDPWAEKLIVENLGKNLVCDSEYRQSKVIHDRLVAALSVLYHAPRAASYAGAATAGSSEAIMLALLAHKVTWKNRRAAEGKATDRPNLVVYSDSHVCWDKAARFFDVELRKVPVSRAGAGYAYPIDGVRDRVDENTICVGVVIGTTYTGACHPVAEIDALLGRIEAERGWDIPIHVDAATGGFLLPFLPAGERIAWDFRLPRVRSINVSGHKYGLVFPGIGWLLFRDASCLPRELVFEAPYLGNPLDTFTLNFSRSAAPIIAQHFNFLRHGKDGFRAIAARCAALARVLAGRITEATGLELVSDLELPIVCFRPAAGSGVDAFELSRRLRASGWVVPAYRMPEGGDGDTILRIVVHERFDATLIARLGRAIADACDEIRAERGRAHASKRPAADLPGASPRFRDTLGASLRRLPAALAYGHIGLLGILDCLLVGARGATSLAAVGFAASVLAPFYVLATSIAFALPPMVAREAPGRGAIGAAARLRECLAAQALVAGVSVIALLVLSGHLGIFRQPPDVTLAARPYLVGMTFALVPIFAFAALREYAIALGRPLLPAVFAALAIAIKLAFGAALVGGAGALGAAISTSIGYGAAAALFTLHLSRGGLLPWPPQVRVAHRGQPLLGGGILAQGMPIAIQHLFELGALYVTGIMVGWLGARSLAGHQVGVAVVNGAALLALSIAQTTSAKVSLDAAHPGAVARAAKGGAALALGASAAVGAALILARGTLFHAAPELSLLSVMVAFSLLADGVQMALAGALRGLLDTRFLSIVTFACWWLFCLPLAYTLAFARGYGVYGIWVALCATPAVTAGILAVRLSILTRERAGMPSETRARPAIGAIGLEA